MKKSRKRLLISSVAMLLVAMLALGTATFAWFTQSTSVTAKGINVRTSKTSSLQIANDDGQYGNGFTYAGFESIMIPSSSFNGSDWYYTSAEDKEGFAAASDATITAVASTSGTLDQKYVYTEQLNIKNVAESGGMAVNDIEITIENISNNYIRIALVPVNEKGVNVAIPTTTDFKNYIIADNSNNSAITGKLDEYYPISATGTQQTTTTIKPKQATSSGKYVIDKNKYSELTSLAADTALHYNLYVWFEGQDIDCYDNNAGTGITATDGIKFTVTGTPASEA